MVLISLMTVRVVCGGGFGLFGFGVMGLWWDFGVSLML